MEGRQTETAAQPPGGYPGPGAPKGGQLARQWTATRQQLRCSKNGLCICRQRRRRASPSMLTSSRALDSFGLADTRNAHHSRAIVFALAAACGALLARRRAASEGPGLHWGTVRQAC